MKGIIFSELYLCLLLPKIVLILQRSEKIGEPQKEFAHYDFIEYDYIIDFLYFEKRNQDRQRYRYAWFHRY
jgi:hypothetical protein